MELNVVDPGEFKDLRVKEVSCSHALSISGLEAEYSLNPYRGCSHGCLYCYAPWVIKESRRWGSFVDVKRNIPNVLAKELKAKKRDSVRVGSVTDPYQKVEKVYRLTRLCLLQLKKAKTHVIIQTKSDLVTRDIDIFTEMDVDVGITVTSLDHEFRDRFEPGASITKARLDALEKMNKAGVKTWAFIGPLIPGENDTMEDLEELVERLNAVGVYEIYLDKLNMRDGIWSRFEEYLDEETVARYQEIYSHGSRYFSERKKTLEKFGKLVF